MFKNIKIAFFGSSEFSIIVLDELKKQGINPDLIVTTPDKPQGRKMVLTPNIVKTWAENNSIEYITPERLKDEEVLKKLSEYNLFIVASYGKIIPKAVIDLPNYHTLNIHPSLLPKYRGPSPLQEQILNAEKNVGVTIMLIDEQVDHGAILAQKEVSISNWPVGFNSLQEILGKEGAKILAEILPDWIGGKITEKEQNNNEATFTKKVEKIDGLIDISRQGLAEKNYLKILAYEDWPGTYFIQKDLSGQEKRVIVKKASFENSELKIKRVIPEGKKEMDYEDYLRGQSAK